MSALDFLSDRDDPRVQAALEDSCELCGVPPGVDCVHLVRGETLDRVVHLARVTP